MTLKFFKCVDDATKDFTKQSGYIFNELSKDVNKSAAFCNAFKQLSNKFIISCFTDNMETPNIIKRFDRKEKEKLELALIAHTLIKYAQK